MKLLVILFLIKAIFYDYFVSHNNGKRYLIYWKKFQQKNTFQWELQPAHIDYGSWHHLWKGQTVAPLFENKCSNRANVHGDFDILLLMKDLNLTARKVKSHLNIFDQSIVLKILFLDHFIIIEHRFCGERLACLEKFLSKL